MSSDKMDVSAELHYSSCLLAIKFLILLVIEETGLLVLLINVMVFFPKVLAVVLHRGKCAMCSPVHYAGRRAA